MGGDLLQHGSERDLRSWLYRHRRSGVSLVIALFLASRACPSKPYGVDIEPITSLRLTAGPDFLEGIQRQLGGIAADWSKNGVGYLVFHPARLDSDPDHQIFRDINVYREETPAKAGEIDVDQKRTFTDSEWKLYLEHENGDEKWFISYKGTRFDTNHGMPVWVNAKPEIFIGILKQNVFVVIAYTSYGWSDSSYVQTINNDIRYAADLFSKASS